MRILLSLVLTFFAFVEPAAAQAGRPRFKDYPVIEAYIGKNAPLDLRDPDARMYHTRLREAAVQKPNFAGHYIVTAWGCGTQCLLPSGWSAPFQDARCNLYCCGFGTAYTFESGISKTSVSRPNFQDRFRKAWQLCMHESENRRGVSN